MAKPDTENDFDAAFAEDGGNKTGSEGTEGTEGTGTSTTEGDTASESTGMTADGAAETAQAAAASTAPTAADAGTPAPAQDEQRLKSWEGRLKARERELNDLQAQLDAKRAEESANTNAGEKQTTGTDDSGTGTGSEDDEKFNKAKAAIVDDFGPEFADNLETMLKGLLNKCGNHSGEVESLKQQIDEVIDGFRNQFQTIHRNSIKDVHEDFEEIVQSPEFQNWCENHPKKDRIEQICQSGSSGQIIKMLTEFKDSKQVQNADAGNDDAEGVSSGSVLIIPASQGGKGSFDDAWK